MTVIVCVCVFVRAERARVFSFLTDSCDNTALPISVIWCQPKLLI